MAVAFPLETEEKLSAMCLHWFLPHGMHLEAYFTEGTIWLTGCMARSCFLPTLRAPRLRKRPDQGNTRRFVFPR
jgi:hypothetical protein